MGFVLLGEEGVVSGSALTSGLGQDDLCDPGAKTNYQGRNKWDRVAVWQHLVLHQGTDLPLPCLQIGVFSPSLRNHYLNVTPNNLVHIYSPDSGDGSFLRSSQPFPKVRRAGWNGA